MRVCWIPSLLGAALTALASGPVLFTPYSSAKPVLDAQRRQLPAPLRNADEAAWNAWSRKEDKAIRARLRQGDLDSMVNLLLLGTSFTQQPRIMVENITAASKAGTLRARVDDLAAGLRDPRGNERLVFLRDLLHSQGIDPADSGRTGVFIYDNLLRVLKEREAIAKRAGAIDKQSAPAPDAAALLDRESLFEKRGVSLDTGIFPDFSVEQTLRDLKQRGVLRDGQVARVAVIGPGLDFIDKNEETAFDYYPQQTVQPFALYDSLLRLGLAQASGVSVSILDISARVLDHVQRARERARKNTGYTIQLPRELGRPWPANLVAYWKSLGDRVGTPAAPIQPPEILHGLETRAVKIRPDVVRACEPVDLNIVLERLNQPAAERFDFIVATNIFVYYDPFEQALALENAGAMLKPGGLLLTNDRLPETPGGSMRFAGETVVSYDSPGVTAQQAIGWYRRQ